LAVQIDLSAISMPEVFRWLAKAGAIAQGEMLRTFNCGIGMVLAVTPEGVAPVRASLERYGETVVEIGRLVPRRKAPTVFSGRLNLGG
jgi:phosphoribosylaminoimidazole (AIR) synthetase